MDIAGHVSKQMLKHYSHIRMEAKRDALEAVVQKRVRKETEKDGWQQRSEPTGVAQDLKGSPYSRAFLRVIGVYIGFVSLRKYLAPQVGLEPTTLRLTAECSAIELLRSDWR
jgi:hypothetical protein